MNYFEGRAPSRVMSLPTQAITPLPSSTDFTRFVTQGLLQPLLDGLAAAAANFSDSMTALSATGTTARSRPGLTSSGTASRTVHKKDCGCDCEETDPCHCSCCITDADLVIQARVGETRVVPLSIDNTWRRERNIKLELSEWTRRGGAAGAIKGTLLAPAPEFTIAPCGHQTIVMIVETGNANAGRDQLPDVDDCTVFYADLRVTGCDIRPIRIALALLPRDCETYKIECTCGCC